VLIFAQCRRLVLTLCTKSIVGDAHMLGYSGLAIRYHARKNVDVTERGVIQRRDYTYAVG
jgi:hypothetical protein